ncbi:MAG: hypothetical protein HY828_03470 [Actinobacteria bacterium]|nr:hypothetical protein [Actinomycetota bacterium]
MTSPRHQLAVAGNGGRVAVRFTVVARPKRVFLDNNLWNLLADSRCAFTVDDLVAAFRSGRLEIVSTIELFEEVLATARRNQSKFKRMRSAMVKLTGDRLLLTLPERHRLELASGGLLSEATRYQPARVRRQVFALSPRSVVAKSINDEVYQRKLDRKGIDAAMTRDVLDALSATGRKLKDVGRFVTAETVRENAIDTIRDGPSFGLPVIPDDSVSFERVPSLWLSKGVEAARLTRTAGEGRAVRASDNHDRLHAAAGAYFEVLVTDDDEFRRTLALVPDLPCVVMTPEEFDAWLSKE